MTTNQSSTVELSSHLRRLGPADLIEQATSMTPVVRCVRMEGASSLGDLSELD